MENLSGVSWLRLIYLCERRKFMNLVIDYGNTRGKTALFDGNRLVEKNIFQEASDLMKWLEPHTVEHLLVSTVKTDGVEIANAIPHRGKTLHLNPQLPLPIKIQYLTPETLGVDRIAGACGAIQLFPDTPVLVIDAGTCVNYEFVDRYRNYHGGAISPGLRMRFESVHHFTARLPLVSPSTDPPLTGRSTEECIQSGIQIGMIEEIKGTISRYQTKYPQLRVVLCGGDSAFFENYLKPTIFVAPDLVLMGLNRILQHNVTT